MSRYIWRCIDAPLRDRAGDAGLASLARTMVTSHPALASEAGSTSSLPCHCVAMARSKPLKHYSAALSQSRSDAMPLCNILRHVRFGNTFAEWRITARPKAIT
jgi:hypothetical protein